LIDQDVPLTDPDIRLRRPHFEHGHDGIGTPLAASVDAIRRRRHPGGLSGSVKSVSGPVKQAFLHPLRMTVVLP
jgi:hypothetical protein